MTTLQYILRKRFRFSRRTTLVGRAIPSSLGPRFAYALSNAQRKCRKEFSDPLAPPALAEASDTIRPAAEVREHGRWWRIGSEASALALMMRNCRSRIGKRRRVQFSQNTQFPSQNRLAMAQRLMQRQALASAAPLREVEPQALPGNAATVGIAQSRHFYPFPEN